MTIQTQPIYDCTLFALFYMESHTGRPLQTSPQDLGYEISQEELACEMLAQVHDNPVDQAVPEVDPEQFETIYQWFLA